MVDALDKQGVDRVSLWMAFIIELVFGFGLMLLLPRNLYWWSLSCLCHLFINNLYLLLINRKKKGVFVAKTSQHYDWDWTVPKIFKAVSDASGRGKLPSRKHIIGNVLLECFSVLPLSCKMLAIRWSGHEHKWCPHHITMKAKMKNMVLSIVLKSINLTWIYIVNYKLKIE